MGSQPYTHNENSPLKMSDLIAKITFKTGNSNDFVNKQITKQKKITKTD